MNTTVRLETIGRHIGFVAAYFLYELGMLYAFTGESVFFWDVLWHMLINLCLFYFNAHMVLAYSSELKEQSTRITVGIILVGVEFIGFATIKYILAQAYIVLEIETTRPFERIDLFLRDTVWRFIYIFGLSFAYWFAISSAKKARTVANLEQARLRDLAEQETVKREFIAIENAYLKSQINSHFLFNTLSYIHGETQFILPEVGQTVLALSGIMRYSMGIPSEGKARLKDELRLIEDIFNVNKLKSQGKMQLVFLVQGEPKDLEIIPLVLVTLAENLLKYADLKQPEWPAKFLCVIKNRNLSIHIENKSRRFSSAISSGIGIKNTEKRLAITYPGRYKLSINNSSNEYQLNLSIHL